MLINVLKGERFVRGICACTVPMEGAVASRLVRSSPDRVVRVRALAGDIVLCS